MQIKSNRTIIFVVLVASILASCSSPKETMTTPASNIQTQEPSINYVPSLTDTIITATDYKITPTTISDSTETNPKQFLAEFIQANGNCKLPCLMGLAPGIGGKSDADAFLSYFLGGHLKKDTGLDIYAVNKPEWGGVVIGFLEENSSQYISIDIYQEKSSIKQVVLSSWASRQINGKTEMSLDDIKYGQLLRNFSLAEILTVYGRPSQILIAPFPDDPGHPSPPTIYPLSIVLVYSEKGFLIQYVTNREESDGNYIGCPNKSSISISAWGPYELPLVEAVRYFSGVNSINSLNISYFRQIQDVTSLSIDTFYQVFKDSRSSDCIVTPIKYWTTK